MSVYLIGLVHSSDPDLYQTQYIPIAQKLIADAGGEPVLRAVSPPAKITVLDGGVPVNRASVLTFPSEEALRSWYDSEEYAKARAIKADTSSAITVMIEIDD